jgi:hypothetical protein
VAIATVATDAEIVDDLSSEWFLHFMADMHSLRMFDKPITRSSLIERFPDWGYWKQPRNSVRVPQQYLSALESMMEGS